MILSSIFCSAVKFHGLLISLQSIYETTHLSNLMNGFIFGALLAMMIYNLYSYIAIRNRSYIYFSLYIFFSTLFFILWNGYLIGAYPSLQLRFLISCATAALIMSILFTNGYLRIALNAPLLFKSSKILIILFSIPLIFDLAGYQAFAIQLLGISLGLAIPYWSVAGYMGLKKGAKPSVFYLIALTILLTSCLLNGLSQSVMSFQTGLCLQVLILTMMLAVNLNDLKKETFLLQKTMAMKTADFSKQLLYGQENERENIANELNNSIGQQLVLLKNQIFVLRKRSNNNPEDLYNEITRDIGKAIEEVSNVSFSLRPYQMDILGLKNAIENLAEVISESAGSTIHLDIEDADKLADKAVEMNLYRVTQELLNNLIKHAMATHCWLVIKHRNEHLKFYYRDNGKGFNPDRIVNGLGLTGIRERCSLMKANISMVCQEGYGTKVYIKIPTTRKDINHYRK